MEKEKRKEREFNQRRAEILSQAEQAFSSKGFYNTTVAEIANASGFAIGTLYQYFESKERLYMAMVIEKLDRMYVGIRESVDNEPDLIKKIEVLIVSQFQFVENNRAFCSIFIRGEHLSLSEGSTELRERMVSDYENHLSFIERTMRQGIRSGVLKEMDPRMMAAALLGIINSCTFKRLTATDEMTLENMVSFVMGIFLEGVREDAR